jgi:hypothetical protein
MRPPKTTARAVCLWLPRLLPGVGAYFDPTGTGERLPTWTVGMYGPGPYVNRAWKACALLIGFPLQGVHQFKSP